MADKSDECFLTEGVARPSPGPSESVATSTASYVTVTVAGPGARPRAGCQWPPAPSQERVLGDLGLGGRGEKQA